MPSTVDHDGYLKKVLGNEEKLLFVVRQHGLFLFFRLFWWLLLGLVLFMAVIAIEVQTAEPKVAAAFLFLLVPLLPIWWLYQIWANHKFVVTSRRVLQIKGVFGKHVVDAALDQINDVKTDQSLLGRMFDYGDVEVVTASALLTDEMTRIARPLEFKRVLMDAKEALMHPAPAPAAPAPAAPAAH